ncbi:uroporphyrinogen decarboxylase [Acidobacteria bacterium AH-259-D05]|nr:uroporphyrinogen decarboxylase [Acidobacteria bacterium AH-259-D05]
MTEKDCRFLKACRGEEVDCTPVWFMRQAGRYLEEYRKLRRENTLLEICASPELTREVTLQPIRRFDLDAAIIFADILLPLKSMGVSFEFAKGEGPLIHHPIRSPEDAGKLYVGDPEEDLSSVFEAIHLVRSELDSQTVLIGFAGAPFTVASYMIEGGYSRNFLHTKLLMYTHPEAWQKVMETIAEVTARYLCAQIEAGAQVIQLFDSWVGCLEPEDYRHYVLPYSQKIFERLKAYSVPLIHFGTGTSTLLDLMQRAGGTVMGVDWRITLKEAWRLLGNDTPVQGNLDPVALLGPRHGLKEKVDKVLKEADGHAGHIFNLGHGILPQTPVESVEAVVKWVHDKSRR